MPGGEREVHDGLGHVAWHAPAVAVVHAKDALADSVALVRRAAGPHQRLGVVDGNAQAVHIGMGHRAFRNCKARVGGLAEGAEGRLEVARNAHAVAEADAEIVLRIGVA